MTQVRMGRNAHRSQSRSTTSVVRGVVALLLCGAVLGGCASRRESGGVIIDRTGVDMAAYREDLEACKLYANEVETGRDVAGGAAAGAAVGGLLGAIFKGTSVGEGAGGGAVVGGARGAASAEQERQLVLRRCLANRGYKVLN